VQAAQQSAALVQRLCSGVITINQLQQPQRRLFRRLACKPAPVSNRLNGLIQAGQGTLGRRKRAPAIALIKAFAKMRPASA
jgi:hypothetical protein